MDSQEKKPSRFFGKKHIHKYLIAIVPSIVSVYLLSPFSPFAHESLDVVFAPDYRSFICLNKGEPELIYNVDIENNTNSTAELLKINGELIYPSPDKMARRLLLCDTVLEKMHKVDFDAAAISSKGSLKEAVILTEENLFSLNSLEIDNALVTGRYHLKISAFFLDKPKPLSLKYIFDITGENLKSLKKKSRKPNFSRTISIHLSRD